AQVPDADALAEVIARAEALPDDLEKALASIVLAQALAVDAAAAPSTPAQGEAMARVLVTVAQALPTLEKHALYWRSAPDALRVGQWDPTARIGWAVEHAAYFVSTRGEPADVLRAAGLLHGTGLQEAAVPDLGFVDAYVAVATQAGAAPNATTVDAVRRAGDALDPAVRRAAAILLSGAAESGRLQREAYAALTPDERALLLSAPALDAPFLRDDVSQQEVDDLARLSALASRVDRAALARAHLVALLALQQARDALDGLQTQGEARPLAPGLLGLLQRLWPTARAQAACNDLPDDVQLGGLVTTDCENDVILRIQRAPFISVDLPDCQPLSRVGNVRQDSVHAQGCAEREASRDLLVVTGAGRSRIEPERAFVPEPVEGCDPSTGCFMMRVVQRALFGAPVVHLDLGGADTYAAPVAMTYPSQRLPVSLHLDMGGADDYQDPTAAFDERSLLWRVIGSRDGHPTQGSAIGGGVAVLFDNWRAADGQDRYQAPAFSQGYGQWGLGMLVDAGGSDLYIAGRYAQGAAGRDFNLGLGVLLDAQGDDRYRTPLGQGYGTGGVLVDLAGTDVYSNDHPALGAPVVHLTILPGGNLTTLDQRADNRFWLDGPAELNLGLAVDAETSLSARNSDGDLFVFSDFVETVFGTDPYDRNDNPQTRPTAQAEKLAVDTDGDGYPDFIERALSTDPR
ncbi:MAG TPA: hypothetical protein VNX21_00490, partial [Candidatus Thermoplasmatota archaeon]|nr:hypothetical protein [Candidatus Thermoplasmatota archaeon]